LWNDSLCLRRLLLENIKYQGRMIGRVVDMRFVELFKKIFIRFLLVSNLNLVENTCLVVGLVCLP